MAKQSAYWSWVFAAGGILYSTLEILWRGYTHWSMTLCGGLCLCLMVAVCIKFSDLHWLLRSALCCGIITAVEFAAGCIVNLWLGWNVWDYSSHRFDLLGQICPLFCVLWFFLSMGFTAVFTLIQKCKKQAITRRFHLTSSR